MKKNKALPILFTIVLLVAQLSGVAMGETNETIYLTDMKGREIVLEAPATRIVVLTP